MSKHILRLAASALAVAIVLAAPTRAGKLGDPLRGGLGDWRLIGTTHPWRPSGVIFLG